MSTLYSGRTGALYINGSAQKAAKVQNWSFSMSQAVIETTSMGDTDRTLKDGIRSYSGSARLFYQTTESPGSSNVADILTNSIKTSGTTTEGGDGVNDPSTEISMKLEIGTDRYIRFFVFITGVAMGSSMGEVSSCDINFEVNGAPVENKLATGT